MFFYLIYGFKNKKWKFLWLDKTFASCSCLWFWFPTREVSTTWQDICSYCFFYSYNIHNRVLITKRSLTKFQENTLDVSSKLKNMPNKRWWCLTKSLLKSEFLLGNVWPFENSYFTLWMEEKSSINHPIIATILISPTVLILK